MQKVLDVTKPQTVSYCIPKDLRDVQIALNIKAVKGRIEPHYELRDEPAAVVCFGPSLNDTYEEIRKFKHVFTCSGSHKFLLSKGIRPTYHLEVDPRKHKIELLGDPQSDCEYLIASTCHPLYVAHIQNAGGNIKLWHVFDAEEDALRTLPAGEWALFGGCSVGLRALTIARFLGFTDLHVFGMDGSSSKIHGKHASAHPNQPKQSQICEYDGKTYETTESMLECARGTFHELDQMPDVNVTFYGEGLVQAMARKYTPNHVKQGTPTIAFKNPELISPEAKELNARLHRENPAYGMSGSKYTDMVQKLVQSLVVSAKKPMVSVLDYGCGKGMLAKSLPYPIAEYDPAIPGKEELPKPADLVVATDVLEHIEPEKLPLVLADLRRCVKEIGYFVIHTGAAKKKYADGRNTHLLQHDEAWWKKNLEKCFTVGTINEKDEHLHIIVGPKKEATPVVAGSVNIFEVKTDSHTMKFYTPNDATKWRASTLLKKEPVTTEWIQGMAKGETLFDVGANIGGYTVMAGTRGVVVFAFEPEADNYSLLVKNMALNGIHPHAYCMALSDKQACGTLRLSQQGVGGSCHSFSTGNGLGFEYGGEKKQGCYGVELDRLVENGLPSPDHIKIDVDGFEPKVVRGATKVLSNGVKSLLVEVNTNSKEHMEMVDYLKSIGFEYEQSQVDAAKRKDGHFKGVAEYLFRKPEPSEIERHVVEKFSQAEVLTEPFPYIYIENVFPSEIYQKMREHMPENYVEIAKSRGTKGYPKRFTAVPEALVWKDVYRDLVAGRLKKKLCDRFGVDQQGLTDEVLLIRDKAGYSIGPHTDSKAKVITVLFYLPADESLIGAGTSIYTPKKAGVTCEGGPHHNKKHFDIFKTMPFKPNSCFAFLKTDNSFHGVEPCEGTRDVLLYDVRRG